MNLQELFYFLPSFLLVGSMISSPAAEIYVSPAGNDTGTGSANAPFQSVHAALEAARIQSGKGEKNNTIFLQDGTYYLTRPLVLHPEDSNLTIKAFNPGKAIISGARPLQISWEPYRDGIMKASVPRNTRMDALFIDGKRQRMARYPNARGGKDIFDGYAADAVSPERIARWQHPETGFFHALHMSRWGGMHYRITGKDADGSVSLEGGWQNNRPSGPHQTYRFVENIFEELDTPGEWYLDEKESILYFYPETGVDLSRAKVEITVLERLLEFKGTQENPVRNVHVRDLVLTQTNRTFMKNKEPLLRSDWTIYRNGAILMEGTEGCSVTGTDFADLGGDAVFVNNYNRKVCIESCYIHDIGGNGVAFVGDRDASRSPRDYKDAGNFSWDTLDKAPGPRSADYPADCMVKDCLITRTGQVEKQTAPVQIAMAEGIQVIHCSLYNVPRAGINIGDGCWGGHLIDGCDIFDTVQETSDHGSFNSWGRDRFWNLKGLDMNDLTNWNEIRDIPFLDARKTTIIKNSRWRCDHGWDIDLDDGSGNYEIFNNLLLNRGLKLREGFGRKVYNNIIVNNALHPHVWYKRSGDVVERNIFFVDGYFPAGGMPSKPWGERLDSNFVHVPGMKGVREAHGLQEASGNDVHSKMGDALFVNPSGGDYRVKPGSPALQTGFRNFPMEFGVVSPRLKKIAKTPVLPSYNPAVPGGMPQTESFASLGMEGRSIKGMGDVSAYGLSGETGVLILKLEPSGKLYRAGVRQDDVIIAIDEQPVKNTASLYDRLKNKKSIHMTISRKQSEMEIEINL